MASRHRQNNIHDHKENKNSDHEIFDVREHTGSFKGLKNGEYFAHR